ncbi:Sapep family Mn(2+)-dependent dipeptidase [Candidatus Sumerlaeota bacterium]|nr:Sapep family Mn(2+)-dependent dipeptidase [Candidatus Sumerlaeota bacterium]
MSGRLGLFDKYGGVLRQNIDAAQEQAAYDLSRILRFETVNGAEPAERAKFEQQRDACFAFLGELSARLGFAFRMPTPRVGVIECGEGAETLGVLTHIDVVPAGKGWTYPPFSGEIADGCIWGRGAQDDKGPLIQFLYALAAVRDAGAPVQRRVRIIIGSEEEGGVWSDIEEYLALESAPDISIVPDSQFPIINGEKGIVTTRLGLPGLSFSVCESSIRFVLLEAGVAANVVPDEATLVFEIEIDDTQEEFERLMAEFDERTGMKRPANIERDADGKVCSTFVFKGHSAHASLPHAGRNAAAIALDFLAGITRAEGGTPPLISALQQGAKDLKGECFGIHRIHERLGETTCSLTMLKLTPEAGSAVFNVRQPFSIEPEEILNGIASKFDGATAEFIGKPLRPIWIDPALHPDFIEALQAAYRCVTGREPKLMSIGGTTYAKALPNALNFGPCDEADGEEELAHQPNERITLEHLRRNLLIYAHALAALIVDE